MPVEIEVHTVLHFKVPINANLEPGGLKCHGTFIFYQARPNLGHLTFTT